MSAPVSVANETLSYCTSCKMDLNHRIVAMKGEKIAKVQCLTCKKEHVYRSPKGVTQPREKASKSKKLAEAQTAPSSIENEWEKLMHTHREQSLKEYSTKGNFNLGDKLNHPHFGHGIIAKLLYPNKLEVIFRNDIKILIYNGTHESHYSHTQIKMKN